MDLTFGLKIEIMLENLFLKLGEAFFLIEDRQNMGGNVATSSATLLFHTLNILGFKILFMTN